MCRRPLKNKTGETSHQVPGKIILFSPQLGQQCDASQRQLHEEGCLWIKSASLVARSWSENKNKNVSSGFLHFPVAGEAWLSWLKISVVSHQSELLVGCFVRRGLGSFRRSLYVQTYLWVTPLLYFIPGTLVYSRTWPTAAQCTLWIMYFAPPHNNTTLLLIPPTY